MVTALHHVQLSIAPDKIEASLRFYVDIVGFKQIEDPFKIQGFWLSAGTRQLHCRVEENVDRYRTRAHPAFVIDNLTAVHETLAREGFFIDPQADFDGFRRIHVLDPSGNRVELMQKLGGG